MKRKTLIFVLLAFIFVKIGNAQSAADGFLKLNQKEYGVAKNIFAELLKVDPKNANALYGMGEYYFYTGKMDSAKSSYQNGIAASSSYACNYAGLGKVNYLSNPAEAELNFKDAIKKSKKDATAIVAIAKFFYEQNPKNMAEAKKYINLAIGVDAKNGSAYFLNGLIEYDQLNASNAALQFDRAIYFDPNQMDAYLYSSKIMASTRNFQQAVEYINKAIAINPNYWIAYKELAELYYDNQKYADAVTNFVTYFKNVPTDKDITHYSYSLFFNKQYKEARELMDKLIAQNPNDYVPLRLLGYISYETKDLVNGKSIMDKFFTLVPADKILTDDYGYYGKMQSASGNDSLAILNYNLALKKDSTQFQLYDEISKSYSKLKKYETAAQFGTKYLNKKPNISSLDYFQLGKTYYFTAYSIKVKPDSIRKVNTAPDVLRNEEFADSLKRLKYYLKADSLFAKVEENSPTSHYGPFWRARVNANIESDSEGRAKPFYEKALEIVVKDTTQYKKEASEIYSYLGIYYFKKEENDSSKVYMKKLLELDPTNSNAQTVIQEIEKTDKKK